MNTVFDMARDAWTACEPIRRTRLRLKNFTYGRQWDDTFITCEGERLTEYEYALRNGRHPITNNLLRSLVKSVVGRFRQNLLTARESADGIEPAIAHIADINILDELDARALEEFLISGCAIQKVCYERRFEGADVWVDNVNPNRFFCNRFLDPRGGDIRLVGMLHDMPLIEMKMRFGHSNRRRQRDIANIYSRSVALRPSLATGSQALGMSGYDTLFNVASDPTLCRVVEVWTFESDKQGGAVWHCRFYSSDGTLIDETVSPYAHGKHPFIVKLYPLTDGEVHPFIEDVIDQQRHINQLITTIDHILIHSAKGALLFPSDALVPGASFEQVINMWSKPGAVIPVNGKSTQMPREVISAGHSEGASQLLDLEMRMFQQISGVSTALQGQTIAGNMSASLYETQVQNSAIALLDIFETFNSFRRLRNEKALLTLS